MNNINLDKTCAEYGMELLKKFSLINSNVFMKNLSFDSLKLENIVDGFKDSGNQNNFDKTKENKYKNRLESKINEFIHNISQNNNLNLYEKYILNTWGSYPLKKRLVDDFNFSKINVIEKEKQRIKTIIKNFNEKFDFSASNFETEITKALGILVEDGPFAYMIWLKSQDKEPHRAMLIQTARVLKELNLIREIEPTENLKEKLENIFLGDISSGLTKILFVKTILEKMLIYARYKAKAMQHE